ncbi:MAG: DUF7402 domain-containing protein [Thermogutta sp.]
MWRKFARFSSGIIVSSGLVTLLGALTGPLEGGALLGYAEEAPPDSEIAVRIIQAPPPAKYFLWPSDAPANCPIPGSEDFVELAFTGRHTTYTAADTWYPSWAADDRMYSCFTDGRVGNVAAISGNGDKAVVGHAVIVGDDPLHLQVIDPGTIPGSALPYQGRYPSANLYYDGVWYIGTYCLAPAGRVTRDNVIYNWPWLGPFVGFHISRDGGKTWSLCPHTPAEPLFGESGLEGQPVKIGAAHVVDFGKELEYSPDGKIYLVSHGASRGPANRRFAYNSWITGDEIYLLRVSPGIENVNDPRAYEFYAGEDANGQPIWTREFEQIRPIVSWDDNMGCVTVTYNAPLKKYLMCVTDGTNTTGFFNSYLLESDRITGPFRMVKYLYHFGEQAYFLNLPSRFISPDGRTMWLCYAANFAANWGGVRIGSNPPGSRYGMCLQEIKLIARDEPLEESVWMSPRNVARQAKISVSSVHPDYRVEALCDGSAAGFPEHPANEWATQGEGITAFVRLTWDSPVTIERVWLFDRPNALDQITGGMLVFSDGRTLSLPALPDGPGEGLEICFAPREVTWLAFVITDVKPGTLNVGLAEMAVFASATNKPE